MNEKEELLLELFPTVAEKYLRDKVVNHYESIKRQKEEEVQRKFRRKTKVLLNDRGTTLEKASGWITAIFLLTSIGLVKKLG
jgi:hypothetical protein